MLELDYQRLLTLLSAHAGPSQSLTKLSSEEVEEETKHQVSKVSNARPFNHKSFVTTYLDVTSTSYSPTMQVPSEPAGEGSDHPREPDSAAVKGECRVNSGGQRWAESSLARQPFHFRFGGERDVWSLSPGTRGHCRNVGRANQIAQRPIMTSRHMVCPINRARSITIFSRVSAKLQRWRRRECCPR